MRSKRTKELRYRLSQLNLFLRNKLRKRIRWNKTKRRKLMSKRFPNKKRKSMVRRENAGEKENGKRCKPI